MNSLLLFVTSYALNSAWQVPVLAGVAWLLCRALQRTGVEVQHRIWVAVLFAAAIVPLTPAIILLAADSASVNTPLSSAVADVDRARDIVSAESGVVLPPVVVTSVSAVYGSVFMLFLIRLFRMIWQTRTLLRTATTLELSPERAAWWQEATQAFHVPDTVLLSSREILFPVTAAWPRAAVLLPSASFEGYSQAEFIAAVGHECAHIHRRDFRKNLLYEVVALPIAFHPAAWFIQSRIAQTREMICDRLAADRLLGAKTYAISLLNLVRNTPAAAPVASHALGIFDTNTLEDRVMNLTSEKTTVSRSRRSVFAGAAVLALALSITLTGSLTQSVSAQSEATKSAKTRSDLSCTYWTPDNRALPGTCGLDKRDKRMYVCYSNADPKVSQLQIGCESKLRRAQLIP